MNCGDFRYLVQRRFDVELSPQDDRALLIHFETCDSCQKFYHQVQQVIIAAEELELSEDLLPQTPDRLFGRIWENIPQEKPGIGSVFHSLLGLFSFLGGKDKKESQAQSEEGLLPRISQISNRKQQAPSQASDFGTGRGFGEQVSHSVTSWGQSSPAAAVQNRRSGINEEEALPVSPVADQVITRSLGEKFGLSGGNPQLNNKQGLSLAESIKQKISEMSKSNSEYKSTTHHSEPAVELIDEWTVPHSPQWPKLNTDAAPEQWPNQIPGTRAPNAWGSTLSHWGGEEQLSTANNVSNYSTNNNENGGQTTNPEPNNQVFNHVSEPFAKPVEQFSEPFAKLVEQSLQQPPPSYQPPENVKITGNNWSTEAEQLETGNWQMVQFDTTLNPAGYPLSNPISPPPPLNNSFSLPISSQPSLPQVSTSQISNQPELTPQAPFAQTLASNIPVQQSGAPLLDFPIENFPQLFTSEAMPGEALGHVAQPEIKPEHAYEISEQPIRSIELQAPIQQVPAVPIQQEAPPPAQIQQALQTPQTPSRMPNITQRNLPALKMDQQVENNENQNIQLQNSETSSTGGPRIYPVVSKRAQVTSAIVDAGFDEGSAIVKPPLVPPEVQSNTNNAPPQDASSIPVPEVLSQNLASKPISQLNKSVPSSAAMPATPPLPPAAALPTVSAFAAIDETAPLFKLDDNAIDRIFSHNLGVHESVVPTQSSQPESFANPASRSPEISTPKLADNSANALKEPPKFSTAPISASSELVMNQYATTASPSGVNSSAPQSPMTPNQSVASSMQPPANSPPANSVGNNNEVSSLFAVDDNLIDRIFTDTLGVPEHISKNVMGTKNKSAPIKEGKTKTPALPIEPAFDSSQELSPQPIISASNLSPTPMPDLVPDLVPDLAKSIGASFGQPTPSGYSSGKQKISGVGKLDTRGEALVDPGSGRIASIGKFLLDNKDLEKIGKITASDLSDSKMRTLTVEANEELKNLLRQIDAQEGVTGTVIVGHDGLLIANTMSPDLDPESIGVWALGVYMGTAHVVEKLGDDNVRQIVSQTNQGYLIIANFGAGLLVTLTSPIMLDKLLPLMRTITQLVAA